METAALHGSLSLCDTACGSHPQKLKMIVPLLLYPVNEIMVANSAAAGKPRTNGTRALTQPCNHGYNRRTFPIPDPDCAPSR
jgi:hypothetical protein